MMDLQKGVRSKKSKEAHYLVFQVKPISKKSLLSKMDSVELHYHIKGYITAIRIDTKCYEMQEKLDRLKPRLKNPCI